MIAPFEQQELIEECSLYLECFSIENGRYTFRCPYCGDSVKSKSHKHGNFFLPSGSDMYIYHCYRCGVSRNVISFLKENCPDVYKDYIRKKISRGSFYDSVSKNEYKKKDKKMINVSNISRKTCQSLKGSVSLMEFEKSHGIKRAIDSPSAISYLNHRRVSEVNRFYYVNDSVRFLYDWTGKTVNIGGNREGLVIPCLTDDGTGVIGFVIRLIRSKVRYLNGKFAEEHKLVWGLDRINIYRPVIVAEGVFDAAVLPNAIAGLKSDLASAANILCVNNKSDVVVIHDNDWRYNKNTKKHLIDTIDSGYRVCIFPKWFPKDINEAIQEMGKEKVFRILKESVTSGYEAKMKMEKMR